MSFWKCYYHIIWATHNRMPLISSNFEEIIFNITTKKAREFDCPIHALNGTADHLHIAISIPPKLAPISFIGQVKGRSAHEINAFYPDLEIKFAWQASYGILTFGEKHLSFVVDYVKNQKTHHAQGNLLDYLERIES